VAPKKRRTARKKICFVLPSLHGGGAERAAVHILNALDPNVWDRSMYLFSREGAYLDAVDGAIALSSGQDRSKIGRWSALRRYFVATKPDLIVSFLSYLSVLSAASAARIGARVVFNQQTPISAFLTDRDYHWRRPWHRRLFSWASRYGYRRADAVVATSKGVADDLAGEFGVAAGRIHVVHNPIDLAAIAKAAAEPIDPVHEAAWTPPVIVAAGRLADAKNYPLLIDAVSMLRTRVPARLVILGSGDREASLRDLVAAKQLEGVVTFAGFQRNPWRYIARADVFALSSRYEGFGNVLIEAMACGVPVVATSSPGTREIVEAGVDGLLVDHEPSALAAALERLVTDEGLHRRMSLAARRAAQRFALPTIAAEYDRAFSEVLA
jgi:glycosyltransferase involved in cell wall biosynthesis